MSAAYITRDLEPKFRRVSDNFKVVLVTGARQTGKTTMLRHLAQGSTRTYVSLDDLATRRIAKEDPGLFFQMFPPPVLVDEVQYAPELFPEIKKLADRTESAGQFWLTGSQHFSMMQGVRESLAGRIAMLELFPLSQSEMLRMSGREKNLELSMECLRARFEERGIRSAQEIFEDIWLGGMPQLRRTDREMRATYFNAYVDTYLSRDAAEYAGVEKLAQFRDFLAACAALVGQQLNYAQLTRATGVTVETARNWLSILQDLGIIYLLRPYSHNALKRLSRTPKLYFRDTGLAAFLGAWPNSRTLMLGAQNGAVFENYVVTEFAKHINNELGQMQLSYFRDSHGNEIDLLIEKEGVVHPIE